MRICVLALSAVLCLPAPLMADTIFSNFAPGTHFTTAPSGDIGGMPGQVQVLAAPFTPDETAVLSDVEIPLFDLSSNPPPFSVYLASSQSNGEPGALVEQLTQTAAASLTQSLIEFTCSTCPQLDEGTTYFVIAVPSTGGNPLNVTDSGLRFEGEKLRLVVPFSAVPLPGAMVASDTVTPELKLVAALPNWSTATTVRPKPWPANTVAGG